MFGKRGDQDSLTRPGVPAPHQANGQYALANATAEHIPDLKVQPAPPPAPYPQQSARPAVEITPRWARWPGPRDFAGPRSA